MFYHILYLKYIYILLIGFIFNIFFLNFTFPNNIFLPAQHNFIQINVNSKNFYLFNLIFSFINQSEEIKHFNFLQRDYLNRSKFFVFLLEKRYLMRYLKKNSPQINLSILEKNFEESEVIPIFLVKIDESYEILENKLFQLKYFRQLASKNSCTYEKTKNWIPTPWEKLYPKLMQKKLVSLHTFYSFNCGGKRNLKFILFNNSNLMFFEFQNQLLKIFYQYVLDIFRSKETLFQNVYQQLAPLLLKLHSYNNQNKPLDHFLKTWLDNNQSTIRFTLEARYLSLSNFWQTIGVERVFFNLSEDMNRLIFHLSFKNAFKQSEKRKILKRFKSKYKSFFSLDIRENYIKIFFNLKNENLSRHISALLNFLGIKIDPTVLNFLFFMFH